MKRPRFNPNDCSSEKLERLAAKCGFVIKEGASHSKVLTPDGAFVTTIPRHKRLKRELVKGVVDALNAHGANVIC